MQYHSLECPHIYTHIVLHRVITDVRLHYVFQIRKYTPVARYQRQYQKTDIRPMVRRLSEPAATILKTLSYLFYDRRPRVIRGVAEN
jgi:hypothetical protein